MTDLAEEYGLNTLGRTAERYMQGEDFENLEGMIMYDHGRTRAFIGFDSEVEESISELGQRLDQDLVDMGYELHDDSNMHRIDVTPTSDEITPPSWVEVYDAVAPVGTELFEAELDREGLRKTAQLDYVDSIGLL